jgi:hypothetical protein
VNVNSQFNGVHEAVSLLPSADSGRNMLPIYTLRYKEEVKEEIVLMLFMLETRAKGISKWQLACLSLRLVESVLGVCCWVFSSSRHSLGKYTTGLEKRSW